ALRDKVEVKNLFTFDSPLTEDLFDGAKKAWEALKTEPNKHLVVWKYRKLREELGFPSPRVEWDETQLYEAGLWLMDNCVTGGDLFILVDHEIRGQVQQFPQFSPEFQEVIDKLREELIWRDPVYLPTLEPPSSWADWDDGGYPIRATFVRDTHP